MKKKLLSLLMATCMVAMVLTGCGEKEATGDDVKSSVEEADEEESDEEESEEAEESEEVVESTEEAEESKEVVESTEEAEESEEVVESTEEGEESEEVVESSEEIVETEEEEIIESEEGDEVKAPVVDEDGKDWSTAYDDYFENQASLDDNFKLDCSALMEGMSFNIIVAVSGETVQMSYDLATAKFDMYATKDKVYAYWELQGQSGWAWAPVESEEDVESLVDTSEYIVDPATIESCTYREAIEEDGVIYDMLDVVTNDGMNSVYFVNRDTQKIEKFTVDDGTTTMVCLVDEIESIEIPEEAMNSEEATMDDIAMSMFGVIMTAAYGMTE